MKEQNRVLLTNFFAYFDLSKEEWAILFAIAFVLLLLLIYFIYKQKHYKAQLTQVEAKTSLMYNQFDHLESQLNALSTEKEILTLKLIQTLPCYQEITLLIKKGKKQEIIPEGMMSTELWNQVITEINNATDNFTLRLCYNYPLLKPEDIYFCCLLKMGLKYSDIACLLGRTTNMMYKRRELIIERIGGIGENASLDEFIRKF